MAECTKTSNLVARLRKVAGPELDHLAHEAADELERLSAALVHIGEQASAGVFTERGDCPATYACSAIITELIDLGMPPKSVIHDPPDPLGATYPIDVEQPL